MLMMGLGGACAFSEDPEAAAARHACVAPRPRLGSRLSRYLATCRGSPCAEACQGFNAACVACFKQENWLPHQRQPFPTCLDMEGTRVGRISLTFAHTTRQAAPSSQPATTAAAASMASEAASEVATREVRVCVGSRGEVIRRHTPKEENTGHASPYPIFLNQRLVRRAMRRCVVMLVVLVVWMDNTLKFCLASTDAPYAPSPSFPSLVTKS